MARKASTTNIEEKAVETVEEETSVLKEETPKKVVRYDKIKDEKISDSEEIEVQSLVPNVSYLDSRTNDFYEWKEVGDIEVMTVETIKIMWRNHKNYFRNMILRPLDKRVVVSLGLTSVYAKYDYLMNPVSYTRGNLNTIVGILTDKKTPSGLKFSVFKSIMNNVINGEISDAFVIRSLEKRLGLDLMMYMGE